VGDVGASCRLGGLTGGIGAEADGEAGVATRSGPGADGPGGTEGAGLGRGAVGAVERIAVVSEGLELTGGGGLATVGDGGWAWGGDTDVDPGAFINCLIRSTVEGSRLARALTLTSSPHF